MSAPALVWLVLGTIWGSTWLAIKVGLADLPPFAFAGVRFVLASSPLVAWIVIRRTPLPRAARDLRLIVLSGLLMISVNYSLVFWAEQYISSGLTAILYTTYPMIGFLLAHRLLRSEPLTVRGVSGVLLGAVGVTLIFYEQAQVRGALGLAACSGVVVAAGATAYAGVLIKRDGSHISPLVMTAGQMVVGLVPILTLGIVLEGNPLAHHWTPRALGALGYLAFAGSTLTFTLLFWLMQRMPVTRTMLIPFFSTVVAVLLGALLLDERLSWHTLLGGAATLGGLAIAIL